MQTITDNILQQLKTLTLLEATELVNQIEIIFKVDSSSASKPINAAIENTNVPVLSTNSDEKTEFNLILEEVPTDKKISILKVVRVITGLGLRESKEMVEAAPKIVLKEVSKEIAIAAQKQLEQAGAKANIN